MELKNKNILLIIHAGALGGAERQALGLAKYLNEACNCTVDLLFTVSSYAQNNNQLKENLALPSGYRSYALF